MDGIRLDRKWALIAFRFLDLELKIAAHSNMRGSLAQVREPIPVLAGTVVTEDCEATQKQFFYRIPSCRDLVASD